MVTNTGKFLRKQKGAIGSSRVQESRSGGQRSAWNKSSNQLQAKSSYASVQNPPTPVFQDSAQRLQPWQPDPDEWPDLIPTETSRPIRPKTRPIVTRASGISSGQLVQPTPASSMHAKADENKPGKVKFDEGDLILPPSPTALSTIETPVGSTPTDSVFGSTLSSHSLSPPPVENRKLVPMLPLIVERNVLPKSDLPSPVRKPKRILDIHRFFQQPFSSLDSKPSIPEVLFSIEEDVEQDHDKPEISPYGNSAPQTNEDEPDFASLNLESPSLTPDLASSPELEPIDITLSVSANNTTVEESPRDPPSQSNFREQSPQLAPAQSFPDVPMGTGKPLDPPDLLKEALFFPERSRIWSSHYSDVLYAEWEGRPVAVKCLRGNGLKLSTMNRKLTRELKTWWELDHPSVLPLLAFVENIEPLGPLGGMVSPYCQHGNASEYLSHYSLPYLQRITLWYQVIDGIAFLHGYYPMIVHGDLKPANILIDDEGHVRICDFGLARLVYDRDGSGMTTTTPYTGTARYKSYELMFNPNAKPTAASDVYALGCLGLEFILSQRPYEPYKPTEIANAMRYSFPGVPPRDLPSSEIKSLWDKLQACWDGDPSERPTAASILQYVLRHGIALAEELERGLTSLD